MPHYVTTAPSSDTLHLSICCENIRFTFVWPLLDMYLLLKYQFINICNGYIYKTSVLLLCFTWTYAYSLKNVHIPRLHMCCGNMILAFVSPVHRSVYEIIMAVNMSMFFFLGSNAVWTYWQTWMLRSVEPTPQSCRVISWSVKYHFINYDSKQTRRSYL